MEAIKKSNDIDYFLQDLVDKVNKTGFPFGITLNVGGTIISGTMITGREFFENISKMVVENLEDFDPDPKLTEAFTHFFNKYEGIYPIPFEKDKKEEEPLEIAFIHLKNAKFYQEGNPIIPGNVGAYWRGRLDKIDGFSFGFWGLEKQ